ncbi:MAG: pyridoxal-phosphate dependent enzyme [Pseudomonadota bacterium]
MAGFKALGVDTHVIGVADDGETTIKRHRVRSLANQALTSLGLPDLVKADDVEVIASSSADYGYPDDEIKEAIGLMAKKEGLVADPVYEGRAIRGLLDLNASGRFKPKDNVMLMHLGGSPAIHAYSEQFGQVRLRKFEGS